MNKDLAGVSAVWRALFGVRGRRFSCLSSTCQRVAEDGFAADDGSVSGDGHSSRCCTVGELLQDCDSVSVMAVQEKCDEKRQGRSSDWYLAGQWPPAGMFPKRNLPQPSFTRTGPGDKVPVIGTVVSMQAASHTCIMLSAGSQPTLAKNARMGHPRFVIEAVKKPSTS